MNTILNELSVTDMNGSVKDARGLMHGLLIFLRQLNQYEFNRLRLPSSEFFEVNLVDNYNLNDWLNDPNVSQTFKTLFLVVGSGQVEPLKNDLSGWWSRRINQEHRLVYRFEDGIIIVCSCRGHYENLQC